MSAFDLSGRVALVTGGNGGIGLGMAKGLAGAGATVVIAGRNKAKADTALAELRAIDSRADFVEIDVLKEESCRGAVNAVADKLGRLDILVNNAGTAVRKPPEELTAAEWHLVMDTNVTSAFLCSQAVYPHMKKAGAGKIINIGSMMTIFASSYAAPYASSKGAIVQMARSFAVAWAKDNIQVNSILPGWIDTELTKKAREQVPGLYERVLARTPAARWGAPDDFAGIAVFLASPASDFLTGTAIPVDGGYSVMA
ncbi:SDR family NAD(P)-dependent oxidoreductase [Pseudolabrys sp. FHR47]|uniref:SDR family NAD(P)-dependent oxidoreductase n=1 Tax=Pseudolabrys sp. FHR47 TaxID=2562284 RepID=UPI0010BEC2ED|nr:glucose 1-dehydrogenase [Pseudolabrys sp. FHR47]